MSRKCLYVRGRSATDAVSIARSKGFGKDEVAWRLLCGVGQTRNLRWLRGRDARDTSARVAVTYSQTPADAFGSRLLGLLLRLVLRYLSAQSFLLVHLPFVNALRLCPELCLPLTSDGSTRAAPLTSTSLTGGLGSAGNRRCRSTFLGFLLPYTSSSTRGWSFPALSSKVCVLLSIFTTLLLPFFLSLPRLLCLRVEGRLCTDFDGRTCGVISSDRVADAPR